MPTYDYECLKCGKTFEVFQRISEPRIDKCPSCKGKARRLIGAGCGLIFKGSGFYITDYKKKQEKTVSDKDSSKSKNSGPEKKSQEASGTEIKSCCTQGKDNK